MNCAACFVTPLSMNRKVLIARGLGINKARRLAATEVNCTRLVKRQTYEMVDVENRQTAVSDVAALPNSDFSF